ncbi:MAG: transcription termination factor Rho [Planctomycetia bacterium]|nr:transcription termination factor Rho [Planctomycetia bacterium]
MDNRDYRSRNGYNGRNGYNNPQNGYGNQYSRGSNRGANYGNNYGNNGGYGHYEQGGGYDGYGGGRGGYNSGPQRFARRPTKNTALSPRKPMRDNDQAFSSDPFDQDSFYPFVGALELHPNGYGFLRDPKESFVRQTSDPFVPGSVIEQLGLREGVQINCKVQPARGKQGPRVREIYDVDGIDPEQYKSVRPFDELTPINPEERLRLETGQEPLSTRVMDILTPLGKGQRALIVAPPRSGKTVLLQQISQAITINHPEVHVIVLLIDERPEEVTDFQRSVDAEVISSSLDCEVESHVRLAQFVTKRCKRLAEMGKDVFLLLDSITRLARAFNKWVGNTGRTMTGGVDIKAMDIPKKIFSSARRNEEGGSLTIVGTALVDTGSRMDELIFQEFKGTGNMELVLDRRLADRRVWPAIDISQSGTRREEKLLKPEELRASHMLRRVLTPMNPLEAMEQLTSNLARCKSNEEFFNRFLHS